MKLTRITKGNAMKFELVNQRMQEGKNFSRKKAQKAQK